MSKTPVFFPIEVTLRDLDYRLALAIQAVTQGSEIYVGSKRAIHGLAFASRGGVYVGYNIFKSHPRLDAAEYVRLKSNGFRVIHLDEEGGVYSGDDESHHRTLYTRLDPKILEAEDDMAVWGEFQKEYYSSLRCKAGRSRIHVTGHPRFDLSKPQFFSYFAELLHERRVKFGKYILFNSVFSIPSREKMVRGFFSKKLYADMDRNSYLLSAVSMLDQQTRLMCEHIRAAIQLADACPDYTIIWRPHPEEKLEYYQAIFKMIPNILVVREGSALPWTLGAHAMIHAGCTTAIEGLHSSARLLCLSLPGMDQENARITTVGGNVVFSAEATVQYAMQDEYKTDGVLPNWAINLIANLPETTSAFSLLTGVIHQAVQDVKRRDSRVNLIEIKKQQLASLLRKANRRAGIRKLPAADDPSQVVKFMPYNNAELSSKMTRLNQILGTSARYEVLHDELIRVVI